MEEKRVWGIHTMDDNMFLHGNKIAIGWPEMGDLSRLNNSRDAFKAAYAEAYPDAKPGSIPTCAGMLYRFVNEVQIGDYIVFPSKLDRIINIGVVESEYKYDGTENDYVQQRDVKWLKHIQRTSFSQGALYEIGSALSFFAVKNYADEFLSALDKNFKKNISDETEDETVAVTAEEIKESTTDYVLKELSKQMKGYPFEEVVANLLQAMGYRTKLSKQGGDHGIDIIPYKDELPPRIVVQVKSVNSAIQEDRIQALKGLMHEGDYGLFVTLSDYTKNAKKFLEDNPRIRGINGPEFVGLFLKYYKQLDDKYRDMIPLKEVFIPVPKE